MQGDVEQQYHVTRMETHSERWPVLDFMTPIHHPEKQSFICQMFILSNMTAKFVIQRQDNILAGLYRVGRIWPIGTYSLRLKTIDYVLSGCAGGNKVFRQEFTHKFWGNVILMPDNCIESRDGAMFKRYPLNYIFETTDFGMLTGVQFVA